jgi:hypothetical protein
MMTIGEDGYYSRYYSEGAPGGASDSCREYTSGDDGNRLVAEHDGDDLERGGLPYPSLHTPGSDQRASPPGEA